MSLKPGLENYKIIKPLGAGSFGKVKRNNYLVAVHIPTCAKVAIKFIQRSSTSDQSNDSKIKREIKILKKFHHPNIIRLYEVIETEKHTILVTEYASDGEFYNLLERRGRFSEDEAKEYFRQILSAIEYCHSFRIAHRDIKPENLLVDKRNTLKLCDFGLANFIRDGDFLKTSCGSPNYASPEIISGEKYCGTEVDIWSLGVILYAIIAGVLPFDESSIPILFNKIKTGKFRIPHTFSPDLSDLISRMLVPEPISRITVNQIKSHPWVFTSIERPFPTIRLSLGLNKSILSKCLTLEPFIKLTTQQAIQLLKQSMRNDFSITYNILLDMEKKSQISEESDSALFKKRTRSYPKVRNNVKAITPNNWVYGIRWNSKALILMERLFVALKENGLEWRIIDNFFLRVRPVNGRCLVRFDIRVYKFEESLVLDICYKAGPALIINEYLAGIYQALNLWYPNY